nr:hypothetical protein [Allokutzneria albata]
MGVSVEVCEVRLADMPLFRSAFATNEASRTLRIAVVGFGAGELAADAVGDLRSPAGRGGPGAGLDRASACSNVVVPHQLRDPVPARGDLGVAELLMDAWRTVGRAGGLDSPDLGEQHLVRRPATGHGSALAVLPLVETRS